ncbi:hypothetical protein GCM10012275_62110 [Longimycelium tulufanense]|uniref:Uncharacterized protein n=1 Tax=Longimycelium tulufanense TaxID=907463 RepID=A0A8J3CIX1_9PSEU|nr:hypothetical protein GCM10012275_62110 [Longimycelium tulufanense]
MLHTITQKALRVPDPVGELGDGAVVTRRQLDAALMQIGFKLSTDLLEHLGRANAGTVRAPALHVLTAVRSAARPRSRTIWPSETAERSKCGSPSP